MNVLEESIGSCRICGKETQQNRSGIYTKYCSERCRNRWYRNLAFIKKVDSFIKENKIEEIEATIKQLKIMGYDVIIKRPDLND